MAIERQNPQDTQGAERVADVGAIPDDPSSNYVTTLTYNGDGDVETIVLAKSGVTWTKTLTYTDGSLTGVSAWVRS